MDVRHAEPGDYVRVIEVIDHVDEDYNGRGQARVLLVKELTS